MSSCEEGIVNAVREMAKRAKSNKELSVMDIFKICIDNFGEHIDYEKGIVLRGTRKVRPDYE